MTTPENESNYPIFRECLSSAIVERTDAQRPPQSAKRRGPKSRRNNSPKIDTEAHESSTTRRTNPEEVAEFIDFIAFETFSSLPTFLQTLSYSAVQHDASLEQYVSAPPRSFLDQIPVSVAESLSVYGIIPDPTDVPDFLYKVVIEYIPAVTKPPPVWATTRTDACEICERDWIPLSYHHLIPRGVHAKVLKKGWHDEWVLNSVAWLCRACHSFVHRMASNEELAREWYTVDRIMERQDVQDWAKWVGRVRWKAR